MDIRITGLTSIPEVCPGDDLGKLLAEAATRQGVALGARTVLLVAQKAVSKSEGALVDLRTVVPSDFAARWARQWGKDPRLVELVLRESRRIVKMDRGVLIAETAHGFITANAGVDQSNVPGEEIATLLPRDPDASARRIREAAGCGAVIVTDTFGRPWREGLVNVAIGVSGLASLADLRGLPDRCGRPLKATVLAVADELAAAGGLAMGKTEGIPAAAIEGFRWTPADGSARTLVRPPEHDLFR